MARLQASSSSPSATLRALVLCSILLFYQVLAYSRRPAIKRQHAVDKRTKQAHGGTTSLSAWRMGAIQEDWDTAQETQAPIGHWTTALIDEVALEVVEAVLGLGLGRNPGASPTEWLVRKALQREGAELGNTGRALVARRCLGVTSLRGRLEYMVDQALEKAGPGWDMLSARCRARLLLGLYVLQYETSPGREGEVRKGLLGGDPALWRVLSSIGPAEEVLWPNDPPAAALAAKGSLPLWLAEEWLHQYGEKEAECLADECNKPGPVTLRWNRLLCPNATDLLVHLGIEGVDAEPCRWSPLGVRLARGRPPHGLWGIGAWREGWFEVQDEGSQLIALASAAKAGEVVLDICAGQGGKAMAMGGMMGGKKGRIWCHDLDQSRLRHLEAGAKRAGLKDIIRIVATPSDVDNLRLNTSLLRRTSSSSSSSSNVVISSSSSSSSPLDTSLPPREDAALFLRQEPLANEEGGICDVVVVDAPCSSTGALRRRPSLRWTLDPNQALTELPGIQRELLIQAQSHVRIGGRLIYATCSVLAQENEEVARWFMKEYGDRFRPLGWNELQENPEHETALRRAVDAMKGRGIGKEDPPGWLRLLPHVHGTDGFFIARWVRER